MQSRRPGSKLMRAAWRNNIKHPCLAVLTPAAGTYQDRTVQLPMFMDTGGQEACLNEASWAKLAPQLDTSTWREGTHKNVLVHGVLTELRLGMGRTNGCNMIGKSWMMAARAAIIADYEGEGCIIMRATPLRDKLSELPRVAV